MAELFTLTLGRDKKFWLEIHQQQQPESSCWNRVMLHVIPGERNKERLISSNDTDMLLLDNAARPARIEGSIVKLESVKC